MSHKFPYKWYLKDGYPAKGIDYHGCKVFSTFACGGGSSMGYKLAGYDVIAANDIDPQMAKVYKQNHHPKKFFECPINDLLKMDLSEYVGIDVLDGSPPCSTFSLAGSRERAWKRKKKFREGQSEQVLSDLFFDWIKLVEKLQPKVAIAENVKGMLIGNAKLYTKQIVKELSKIGYEVQVFLLNAASMGVPQKRERVFFICSKQDTRVKLDFNEDSILFGKVRGDERGENPSQLRQVLLKQKIPSDNCISDINERVYSKVSGFNALIIKDNGVCPTIIASELNYRDFDNTLMTKNDLSAVGTFPVDYDFLDVAPKYLVGMSVPPVMMAQVAHQVYLQVLKSVNKQ